MAAIWSVVLISSTSRATMRCRRVQIYSFQSPTCCSALAMPGALSSATRSGMPWRWARLRALSTKDLAFES